MPPRKTLSSEKAPDSSSARADLAEPYITHHVPDEGELAATRQALKDALDEASAEGTPVQDSLEILSAALVRGATNTVLYTNNLALQAGLRPTAEV